MSTKLKLYLGEKVIDKLIRNQNFTASQLKTMIEIGNNVNKQTDDTVEMNVSLKHLEKQVGIPNISEILKIEPDNIIKKVHFIDHKANRKLSFEIKRDVFIEDVFQNCPKPDESVSNRNIVIEYSSPNIAKPFHVGHLRSTIIGNFISNLHKHLKDNVTRINYLGDWGTQFGYMKVGSDLLKQKPDEIKAKPLKLLYEAYVYANKLAETDKSIADQARLAFTQLEKGQSKDMDNWKNYMNYSVKELEGTYNRLGVTFDVYNYESTYNAQNIQKVLKILQDKHILEQDSENRKFVSLDNERKVSLLKSDGSSLYLTRDIAAAIDRYSKYSFDQMLYVVDNGQSDHFNAMKYVLNRMDYPWESRLLHVKFGRIHGMSTRKGNVVFLHDILNEVGELMQKSQIRSPNTKVPISDVATTDILGISCIIVNELKQRRQKDYKFTWERALQVEGDTGVKLQYTHCRLCSLIDQNPSLVAKKCDPQLISEKEVTNLAKKIAQFNTVLYNAMDQLESCNLVTYLFQLCDHINKAFKVLQVKGQEESVASQRLLVFVAAREILSQGMNILGLQPLRKM